MKKTLLLLVSVFIILLSGCNQEKSLQSESISLSLSGIEFSEVVNGNLGYYEIKNDSLLVVGGEGSNYFIAPDGSRHQATAPILLTEVDNLRPFTFEVCQQSAIQGMYDAGAVYIYLDNDNWLKFAFERDELGRRRVVTVRTDGSSDDNNHDIIAQDFVYMKISSNVKQIGFYYSLDGENWNLARLFRNEYPARIWIRLSSQSPKGKENITVFKEASMVDVAIENFRLGK